MKKKVLIIAKSLHQSRILKEKSDIMIHTEIVILGEDDILETIRTFQPQHVVCYLNHMEKADKEAVAGFLRQQGLLNSELILLGTQEECDEFKEETNSGSFIEIKCPVSLNNFLLSLEAILDCQCKEKLEFDVYKRDILVIENDPFALDTIKLWMEDTYRVTIVNSCDEGLEFLEKKQADLILLEYSTPGMDGKEILKKIRNNPKTKNIPVFFLAGLSDNEEVKKIMELKPQGYFGKTAQKEEVLTAIANFLDVL